MLVIAVTMGAPGSHSRADDDGVDVSCHRMFHIGWYKQEGAYGVGHEVIEVQVLREADFQYTLNDRDPGV